MEDSPSTLQCYTKECVNRQCVISGCLVDTGGVVDTNRVKDGGDQGGRVAAATDIRQTTDNNDTSERGKI